MRVLVSGGTGYIGSHTVVHLIAAGHDVVVVDSFGNAKPAVMTRLDALTGAHIPVQTFDLTDKDKTEALFAAQHIDAVIHFAGPKAVGESVEHPLDYYENNLESTFSLLRAMRRHDPRLPAHRPPTGMTSHPRSKSHISLQARFIAAFRVAPARVSSPPKPQPLQSAPERRFFRPLLPMSGQGLVLCRGSFRNEDVAD